MFYRRFVSFVVVLKIAWTLSFAHISPRLDFADPADDQWTIKDISSAACSRDNNPYSSDGNIYKRVVQCPVKQPPIKINPTNPSPKSSEETNTSDNPCFDPVVDQFLSCGGDEHGDTKYAPVIEWVENCVRGKSQSISCLAERLKIYKAKQTQITLRSRYPATTLIEDYCCAVHEDKVSLIYLCHDIMV